MKKQIVIAITFLWTTIIRALYGQPKNNDMKKIIIRQAKNGQWYAVIMAGNGKIIFKTSEYYKEKRSVYKAIQSLRNHGLKTIEEA